MHSRLAAHMATLSSLTSSSRVLWRLLFRSGAWPYLCVSFSYPQQPNTNPHDEAEAANNDSHHEPAVSPPGTSM